MNMLYNCPSYLAVLILCLGTDAYGRFTPCDINSVNVQEKVNMCQSRGAEVVSSFINQLHEPTDAQVCMLYLRFEECMTELQRSCDNANDVLESHWWTLYAKFACLCHNNTDCLANKRCLEDEVRLREFFPICNYLYEQNINQMIGPETLFLQDRLQCEIALIASGCGEEAARLYKALFQVKYGNQVSDELILNRKYYEYTPACSQALGEHVKACVSQHPTHDIVDFSEENDLIPTANRHKLANSCRSFTKYMSCLQLHETECPEGTERLFDYGGSAKMYNVKMSHICGDSEFIQNARCYRRNLIKPDTTNCTWVMDQVQHLLREITAYKFYCEPQSSISVQMKQALAGVTSCYEQALIEPCGKRAARSMKILIQKAFQEPYYLLLNYKPDCKLFKLAMNATSTVSETTALSSSVMATTYKPVGFSETLSPIIQYGTSVCSLICPSISVVLVFVWAGSLLQGQHNCS